MYKLFKFISYKLCTYEKTCAVHTFVLVILLLSDSFIIGGFDNEMKKCIQSRTP